MVDPSVRPPVPHPSLAGPVSPVPFPPETPADPTATVPPFSWDRTIDEENERRQNSITWNTPFPSPPAKLVKFPDFCAYVNALYKLPVGKFARVYVHRWYPSLKPIEFTDKRLPGIKRMGFPSDTEPLTPADGPLSEQMIMERVGVGDYTFRCNDNRRPLQSATVLMSDALATKRDYDHYPPLFDPARLDLDDPKNAVYIKFARSRGILKAEDSLEKEQADMAQATVVESALADVRRERDKADQIRADELNRARAEAEQRNREAEAAKEQLRAAQMSDGKPATPAGELLTVASSLATLAASLRGPQDTSLKEYLALQKEQTISQREKDNAAQAAATAAAERERARADKLHDEMMLDLRARVNQAAAPAAPPPSEIQVLENEVRKQELLKTLYGKRSNRGEDEEAPAGGLAAKFVENAGVIAPMVTTALGMIGQMFFAGLNAWNVQGYNAALAKGVNPEQLQRPAGVPASTPPGPIPPQPPPPTAEQAAEAQRLTAALMGLEEAAEHIQNAVDDGDSGYDFATAVIKYKRRPAYDQMRQLGMTPTGEYDFRIFLQSIRFLMMHPAAGPRTKALFAKVGELEAFARFLKDFFDFDALREAEDAGQQGAQ